MGYEHYTMKHLSKAEQAAHSRPPVGRVSAASGAKREPLSAAPAGGCDMDLDDFEIAEFSSAAELHSSAAPSQPLPPAPSLAPPPVQPAAPLPQVAANSHAVAMTPNTSAAVTVNPPASAAVTPSTGPGDAALDGRWTGPFLYAETECQVCSRSDNDHLMLLCDGCDLGYHTTCLEPPLSQIPEGEWLCPPCLDKRNNTAEGVLMHEERDALRRVAATWM